MPLEHARAVAEEMLTISGGDLHCLPSSRALLDYFESRGVAATPLVVRAVVFGATQAVPTWPLFLQSVSPEQLFRASVQSEYANGRLQLALPPEGSSVQGQVILPYRTVGFTHGHAELGSFHEDGSWNGHLVVVSNNTLFDLTIGQLNDANLGINFSPPYVTLETDPDFLAGRRLLIGIHGGMMVCYLAFPAERSFEQSQSWTGAVLREQLRQIGRRAAERAACA